MWPFSPNLRKNDIQRDVPSFPVTSLPSIPPVDTFSMLKSRSINKYILLYSIFFFIFSLLLWLLTCGFKLTTGPLNWLLCSVLSKRGKLLLISYSWTRFWSCSKALRKDCQKPASIIHALAPQGACQVPFGNIPCQFMLVSWLWLPVSR